MTQPSLFAPTMPDTLTGVPLQVASILYEAKEKWTTSKQIAQRLGMSAIDVRHVIQELIDEAKLPIVGDRAKGFRFTSDSAEFDARQIPNVRQAITSLARAKARLGEKRFHQLIARLAAKDAISLVKEISL